MPPLGESPPDPHRAATLQIEGTASTRAPGHDASLEGAGWSTAERLAIQGSGFESLSWFNLRTLWCARDERVAEKIPSLNAALRNAWLDTDWFEGGPKRREAAETPIVLHRDATFATTRVLLLGDTGDRSEAQKAVAQHLAGRAAKPGVALKTPDVTAVLIESDVVYPSGAADEYPEKFYEPYSALLTGPDPVPIYAVPGNHDWNDGNLFGFMAAFGNAGALPGEVTQARRAAATSWRDARRVRWPLWHAPRQAAIAASADPVAAGMQPAPYVALDIGGVLFIGIDTGFGKTIDAEQAGWLVRMAEGSDAPKILFCGRPLIVNGERHPCAFEPGADSDDGTINGAHGSYGNVDDVVRNARNCFVAAIGGDVHNYQRYLAHITQKDHDGNVSSRTLPYLVCGGGGVYIGQTIAVRTVDINARLDEGNETIECREDEMVLFPVRAHSRIYLSAIVRRALRRARFTFPVGAAFVALFVFLVWVVSFFPPDGLPVANAGAAFAILLVAVAVNISARPRTLMAYFVSLACAALGILLAKWSAHRGVDLLGVEMTEDRASLVIGAAFLGGLLTLQFGESPLLSGSRGARLVGQAVSLAAGFILWAATVGTLYVASPPGRGSFIFLVVDGLVALLPIASAYLIGGLMTVERAFDEEKAALDAPGAKGPWRRRIVRWATAHQRVFSIFETFTEGRVDQHVRVRGMSGNGPILARRYLPLYRSFLEIEFRKPRAPQEPWCFAFTAHAVTGTATSDTTEGTGPPTIADAFAFNWRATTGVEILDADAAAEQL
jgi:Calcineurin-like phosphoesterase